MVCPTHNILETLLLTLLHVPNCIIYFCPRSFVPAHRPSLSCAGYLGLSRLSHVADETERYPDTISKPNTRQYGCSKDRVQQRHRDTVGLDHH